ncbi:hemagglutinin repeat-containing protein [Ralstonia pseudosolanacearum]|uniref:hemagglutinin repeat-containing protein n=1 Tax=Ralstonia pseudosolanacearum TaxID=1310165 RepID=UPI002674A255|nr:hemagglutinin repeat-containing protein [Ralstonia pseudosolanacearum]MDO3518765.1 hemagglutinin repeat-containing protein [Ralstonia pseudosolanacearum]MDO3544057.1 hemagglutinin repeat-containing protein [Ralstonia pseudosolanacearum]
MNAKCYRTVFNAVRGMLVAVEESARSTGKGRQTGGQAGTSAVSTSTAARFAVLPVVFGAWCVLGVSYTVQAQVVAAPGSGAHVIQTQNGLQQVNIARPNGSGVSLNTYTQFNVPSQGTLLNNAPGITQTQQAGYINGNPNLLPGGSARIIVNQVTSTSPSTLRGYLEVAGPRAEVVIANPNGILVNGGGFVNTSRATLTTGVPVFGGSGSLDAYRVTGGQITVQGAGLNASNVDQVDLIARAVSVNASVYANQLNVVAGANQVDRGTLNVTPIAGDGTAPGNGIDVSQLGGMYANKILLASTEKGVGVSLRGVAAAQAGDLTLTSQGKLVLAGQTNASGNLSVSAQGGIDNTGTTYGRQSVTVGTSGDLTNSGTLAAQQNLGVNAHNVASSGTLGAGVNSDGSLAHAGDLSVVAGGAMSATGQNVAGGNATLQGASVNLAGSQTSANGNLSLNAQAGNLDLTGATTSAGGALSANAQGALINDRGHLSSQGATAITAGSLSNQNGQIVSQSTLSANVTGALANQGGTLQAAGALNANAGSLDNTAGHIASLNTDGLNLTTTGRLNNAQGGTIGGNGNVTVQAGQLSNASTISAVQNLGVSTAQTLTNAGGTIAAGQRTNVSAATLDNSAGTLTGNQLALAAANLFNRSGTITQAGTGPITIGVSGTLDNTGGAIRTNSADLTLAPATLINDHGTIADSGTGTLSVTTGSLSNTGGTIATNGALDVQAGAVSNQGGKLSAQSQATLNVASLDNSAGGFVGAQGVSITDQGVLNNAGGTVAASGALTVSAGAIANAGGAIKNAGTQATRVSASQSLDNTQGGLIGGNGEVSVSGGSVDNSGGTVVAGGNAVVQSGSTLRNAVGRVQAKGSAAVTAAGAITNTGGQIEADGAAATLQVTGASLDNTNGRIANAGSGATTVGAASITNANTGGAVGAGTIGGNGDVTVSGQTLSNTQGGQIVAGHDLTLATTRSVNNSGGTLSAANNVTANAGGAAVVNQAGSIRGNGAVSLNAASIDNTSGKIGNDAGSGGSVAMTTGSLANQGGAIGSDRNLSVTTGQLSGDGRIIAGGDGAITIHGNYTHSAASQIQANHNLTLTTTGALINQGTLAAVNALTVNAASVDNRAGADLNSASTAVNAGGALTNAGRIEGDTVATQSGSLANTGTVIGNNVTLNARAINNTGPSAALAAATQLNLYASDSLSNTGGATIFSLGDVNIAANGARDGSGLLANRSNLVNNDQSTIEAQGNLEIAAQTLNNTRPEPTVQTVTTGTTATHETKRGKYMACATMNAAPHGGCTQAVWNSGYKTPIDATFSTAQIVSQSSGPNPVDNVLVVNVNGQNQTIYYNAVTNNGNGTVTVNYWDAYDPHTNYVPSTEYATRSDGHNGYQRVEIARDTTTTTQQDQVTSSAPQARLLSGRNMTLANVGTINNNYSAIAAGGSIRIGTSQQGGAVGSGNYGGTTVNNVGRTLYQYQTQNIVSTYAWNEGTNQDVGAVAQAPVVMAPVAIGGTGGTLIANNAVQINATNLNNTNVAAASSATGATGGTLGANQSAAGVASSGQQTVGAASAQQPAVNAPQSVAGSNGALNISLPTSGLFSLRTAPGQPYLIATDPRLTSYTKFISSDYMLSALNLNPQQVQKRLGDGFYEEKLVRDQITQLTGRVRLQGYGNNEDQYRALMASGVNAAKQFSLVPGIALTAAQMDALTSDIVWLVSQTVTLPDGSTQQVLAPVVYLAHTHANDLQPTGALIAADDVEIHAVGSATNSGVIKGGTQTVITATDIINRGGTIASDKTRGTTVVSASHDILNASGEISGNRVAAQAGHDIVNTTLVDTVGATAVAGDSRANVTLVGRQGAIASTGDLLVRAGNDLTVHGANITAGGNAQVTAGHDLLVDAVRSTTSQSVTKNGEHHWEADSTTHQGSTISAGGSLAMQSGNDTTFKGATVSAGQDLSVIAGGNLTATTVTDTSKYNNVAADSKTRQEVDRTYDEAAVGTAFSAGRHATLAAVSAAAGGNARTDGKGNVTLTGSSVTAGTNTATPGAITIAGNGNVTLNEGREEHDSYQATSSKRGSVVNGSTTGTMQSTQANIGMASTVSGDSVVVRAGKDLTIQGSNVVGTNDVTLGAGGSVKIAASENTERSQNDYSKREYGFLSGLTVLNQLDGGLQGYVIGTRTTTNTQQATQVSHTGSMVGSINGNLNIASGNDLHVTGSTLHAGNDLALAGKTVKIDAVQDTATESEQQSFRQTAISAGLSSPVIAAIQTARQMASAAKHVDGDPRLMALAAVTTGLAAKNAYDAVGGDPVKAATSVGLNISLGSSKSDGRAEARSSTAVGSTVSAGHNVTIAAAGAGKDSNIDVIGSTVSAGHNALLNAEGSVNLQAGQSTSSQHSTNSGASASIGISIGMGSQNGIAFTAGVSGNRGRANGDSSVWTNTHVTAGDTLTIRSGGDTTLKGAVASGRQVIADVGGNLNVESLQNTDHYDSKQQSAGVSVSICVPPICYGASSVSGNVSQNKLNSDYSGVMEQSGIKAGDGGFQVGVKGNTDLKGGVIASSDKAVQEGLNRLTTATLTHSDIQNQANYSGSQVSISGEYSFGGGSSTDKSGIGKDQQGKADNVKPAQGTEQAGRGGFSAKPPVVLSASGSASSTTRSAISGGAITITDGAKQQQLTGQTAAETVASINRDTSNTGGALAPIFDKDKIQAGFEIASQFINQVGTFVDNRLKEVDAAKTAAKNPNLTPEQRAQAQQRADQLTADWGPGGTYRQVLTALTVAAGGNVTGGMGQFVQNATVAYLQELGANQVKQIADSLGSESARAALHAIVGCAGAAASSQSCGAGAMGAATSSVLGSLLGSTDGMSASDKQARENLVTSLVAGIATASGVNAATATNAAQIEAENNQLALPKLAIVGVDLVRKYCGATQPCTDKQVRDLLQAQNALNSAAGKNATVAVLLLGGPTLAAAGVALAALAPEMLAVALANPTAAVNAGIITVETAAAIATNSVTPVSAVEGAAVRGATTAASGVWRLDPIARGVNIESQLAKTEYSAANGWFHVGAENNGYFPLVDFQKGNTLVSLKTVDTTGSTWLPRMEGVIDQLGSSGATVNGVRATMVLDLRVQPGGAAAAQSLVNYGATRGVAVSIKVYP